MEGAGKSVDSEELAEALKERGLGTPATRSAIIDNLISKAYLLRDKRAIKSTAKGRELIAKVSKELKSPELTGESGNTSLSKWKKVNLHLLTL